VLQLKRNSKELIRIYIAYLDVGRRLPVLFQTYFYFIRCVKNIPFINISDSTGVVVLVSIASGVSKLPVNSKLRKMFKKRSYAVTVVQ